MIITLVLFASKQLLVLRLCQVAFLGRDLFAGLEFNLRLLRDSKAVILNLRRAGVLISIMGMLPNNLGGGFPLNSRWSNPLFMGTYSDDFFEKRGNCLFGNSPIIYMMLKYKEEYNYSKKVDIEWPIGD